MIEKLFICLALINILMDSVILAILWKNCLGYDPLEDEKEIIDYGDILNMEIIDCDEDDV